MRIVASRPDPALFSLPWDQPLEEWTEHVVPLPRGLSRHVVRVLQVDGTFYAVKETQREMAEREYGLLRQLVQRGLPTVAPQAVVSGRATDPDAALVTRHLAYALPYRALFINGLPAAGLPLVIDALVVLLVRLHLAGFYWGDVSLSNVLFRRSAGEFAAYLVDAETGEFHPDVSPRMREYDVTVGCENVFAELLDLHAAGLLGDVDPHAVIEQIRTRYDSLWEELFAPEQFSTDEMWHLEQRISRLNDLGFDVEELDMTTDAEGSTVRIQPRVVEAGHYARELEELTGLEVENNQARRLLNDLSAFSAFHGIADRATAAERWRTEVYQRIARMIPAELRGRLEPAEVFHEILEHRWLLSERAGHEIDIFEVAEDYIATQLAQRPETRLATEP
ncbi:DUF4032 domain-containing protein [Nocardioides terrisoli]|uniref:DUF4032 domain-containing protein n=1 Tax=Nocardioides terrisoli TaxID=3388267 RepID=UPI00287BC094|nr:DUF4032 domain-containing protein [Nocardioides marmorisolisilvae]